VTGAATNSNGCIAISHCVLNSVNEQPDLSLFSSLVNDFKLVNIGFGIVYTLVRYLYYLFTNVAVVYSIG
jgi:hypothetical protein